MQSSLFTMAGDVLKFIDPRRKHQPRVAVPAHLKRQVLEECHRGLSGGHFSVKKTYDSLTRTWWWEGMYAETQSYVGNCPECAIVSGKGCHYPPPLHPIPVKRPFQIIGVDMMDLPKMADGNQHVQDYLTKWPMVYAIPDQKALRIAQILVNEIMPFFGVPECLLSDRGTNLLSHLMTDLCKMLGINKLNTMAYHPECDGMVKRFNRTLKSILRKHAARFGNQWDRFLPGVLWPYRNAPHESTGEKPSYLLFGVDLRSLTEAAFLPSTELDWSDVGDYRKEVVASLSSARSLAVESIHVQKSQKKYKEHFDKKAHQKDYHVRDQVLVHFPQEEQGKLHKLSQPWHGPYRVVSCKNPDVTVVKMYYPEEGQIQIHQSRVCHCPSGFSPGYFWYGNKRHSVGRPPKWIQRLIQRSLGEESENQEKSPAQYADVELLESPVDLDLPDSDERGDSADPDSGPIASDDRDIAQRPCQRYSLRQRIKKPDCLYYAQDELPFARE